MNYLINSSWLPKEGNTSQEYEDAFYPKDSGSFKKAMLTIAVSDGASESMLSGKWAEFLVRLCCKRNNYFDNFNLLIDRACRGWRLWLKLYVKVREKNSKPIQWYEEPGLNTGSFASVVCLKMYDNENIDESNWEAIALGDSCLFQVRNDKLISRFPISKSSEFNNRPFLLASNISNNTNVFKHVNRITGRWGKNDIFFLMTDAIAAWFLKQVEDGESPWIAILDFETSKDEEPLSDLVKYLRRRSSIRNDDVTVIRLDIR